MGNEGPRQWWLNRKSRMGMQVSAKEPPHLPNGKPWWTEPPISSPEPAFIEYAINYLHEVSLAKPSPYRNALQAKLSQWIRAARQLLHYRQRSMRPDLQTTDGLIVAACSALYKLRSVVVHTRPEALTKDVIEICDAVGGRADEIRARHARKVG